MLYISSRYDGIVYQVDAQRQHVGLRGRHGRGDRDRVRPRRESVRRRPQRHDFQDQPQPPDFRLRHARAFHRRLSSGVRAGSVSVRHAGRPRRASIQSTASRTTGEVEVFYRGLGRPQGMAFDDEGRLYVAASIVGRQRRGAHRPRTERADCFFPARASSAWRSRLRARWWSPPPTRSIAWTSASRGWSSLAVSIDAR